MCEYLLPVVVLSSDGKSAGVPTGGTKHCQLEGCNGLRVGVRWGDGKLTWPCTKGMTHHPGDHPQILQIM